MDSLWSSLVEADATRRLEPIIEAIQRLTVNGIASGFLRDEGDAYAYIETRLRAENRNTYLISRAKSETQNVFRFAGGRKAMSRYLFISTRAEREATRERELYAGSQDENMRLLRESTGVLVADNLQPDDWQAKLTFLRGQINRLKPGEQFVWSEQAGAIKWPPSPSSTSSSQTHEGKEKVKRLFSYAHKDVFTLMRQEGVKLGRARFCNYTFAEWFDQPTASANWQQTIDSGRVEEGGHRVVGYRVLGLDKKGENDVKIILELYVLVNK